MPQSIWKGLCEVLEEPGHLPPGGTRAFVPVTTWAESFAELKTKVSLYFASHQWRLLSIQEAHPIDEGRDYDEETADMIARTRADGTAITLGRFLSARERYLGPRASGKDW